MIASVTLVRCGHRESFTVSAWVTHDDGEGEPEPLAQRQLQFGPFDTPSEISGEVIRVMRAAIEQTFSVVL